MHDNLKTRLNNAMVSVFTLSPWLLSTYVLYYFEYAEVWTTETSHRGKLSVAILVTGMVLSFLIHSFFSSRKKSQV
jgi:hypothetical protein